MNPPLVSIIVPCHNAAPWLAQSLESALAQTHPAIEVLVVDDGSTDDSLTIARRFGPRGVQVVSQANRGASAARNHGLRLARGDFVQFLDADDLLAPDKIATQLGSLAPGDAGTLLSGTWARFHASPAEAVFRPEPLATDLLPVDFLIRKFTLHAMVHPAAWLVSRPLIAAAGGWDERLSLDDDGEYFARVALAARTIRYCATALSYYRSRLPGSLSRSRSDRAWASAFLAAELAVQHLLAREDSPRTRAAAADYLQRLVFEAYPHRRDDRHRVEARMRELGGSRVQFEAGPRFHLVARLLGWRLAKRLRNRFV